MDVQHRDQQERDRSLAGLRPPTSSTSTTSQDGVTDIGPESVARLRELLPVGSYLGMTHITDEGVPPDVGENLVELKRMYDTSSSSKGIWRSHKEIEAMLGDFEVLAPGWTWLTEWHPEDTGPSVRPIAFPTPNHAVGWAGAGRKPR